MAHQSLSSLSIHITLFPLPCSFSWQRQFHSIFWPPLYPCVVTMYQYHQKAQKHLWQSQKYILLILTWSEWRWRRYLLAAVGTMLYHQSNAPAQHSSVLSLGPMRSDTVGLCLHLKITDLSCQKKLFWLNYTSLGNKPLWLTILSCHYMVQGQTGWQPPLHGACQSGCRWHYKDTVRRGITRPLGSHKMN